MMVQVGLLVRLKVKPGKEMEVARLLEGAQEIANGESAMPIWFALRLEPSVFGIFNAFPDEAGRTAHLEGELAKAVKAKGSALFVEPPMIEQIDILASKVMV
ncbi:MAG: antibiotic biosynthesis monooxygenase [Nitrospira sp.]|nr:antibiotic biosynthesis monooxygenase [Nitrospira sp.]